MIYPKFTFFNIFHESTIIRLLILAFRLGNWGEKGWSHLVLYRKYGCAGFLLVNSWSNDSSCLIVHLFLRIDLFGTWFIAHFQWGFIFFDFIISLSSRHSQWTIDLFWSLNLFNCFSAQHLAYPFKRMINILFNFSLLLSLDFIFGLILLDYLLYLVLFLFLSINFWFDLLLYVLLFTLILLKLVTILKW